jgi:type I restriction enzyme S subunit
MSKLEELIQKYCPDGVEYHKIKEVYKRVKGTPITAGKMKEIATPDGSVRIFAGGKTVIDANEEDIPNANITRVPAVLVQSRGVIDAVYYDKPFTFKNEMWAYTTSNPKSVKYLYYVLKNNIQVFRDAASGMGSLPQISLGVTEDFEIPIPPLPVQEEIVRVLDSFTELQAELQTELQTELQKRLLQYNYYRDNLLSFEGRTDVEWKKLGDVADLLSGFPFDSSQFTNTGIRLMRGMNIKRGQLCFNEKDDRYWKSEEGLEKYIVQENDIIISMDGSLVGRSFGMVKKEDLPLLLVQRVARVRSSVFNINFIYHCINNWFPDYVDKKKTQGAIPHISMKDISNFPIPSPSLDEQERIASILDRFDALTRDLTSGIPAEIEKRRQQYEFYRDKLLTFKIKEA